MSETKVEIIPAKEVSAVMSHPKSCMCEICQPGSGMVYSPEGSSGAEQRIAALEEQLQIRDAEIHLLKESRAAAVSQKQTSRVECNKLRTQLAEAQAEIEKFRSEEWISGAEIGEFQDRARNEIIRLTGCPESRIDGKGSDAGWEEFTIAEISQGIAFVMDQRDEAQAGLRIVSDLAVDLLKAYDRLRNALMNLWNKGPDCPGVQEEVEAALKGQP